MHTPRVVITAIITIMIIDQAVVRWGGSRRVAPLALRPGADQPAANWDTEFTAELEPATCMEMKPKEFVPCPTAIGGISFVSYCSPTRLA